MPPLSPPDERPKIPRILPHVAPQEAPSLPPSEKLQDEPEPVPGDELQLSRLGIRRPEFMVDDGPALGDDRPPFHPAAEAPIHVLVKRGVFLVEKADIRRCLTVQHRRPEASRRNFLEPLELADVDETDEIVAPPPPFPDVVPDAVDEIPEVEKFHHRDDGPGVAAAPDFRAEARRQVGDAIPFDLDILVEDEDVAPRRRGNSGVHRAGEMDVLGEGNDANAGIFPPDEAGRPVRRPAVNGDDFELFIGLGRERAEAISDVRRSVMRDDDNADEIIFGLIARSLP